MPDDIAFLPPAPPIPAPPTSPPGTIVAPIRIAPILIPLAQLIVLLLNEHFRRQCEQEAKKQVCYAAVPEWWATRPGYNRSQLILHFRQKDLAGKWIRTGYPNVMTIPWVQVPSGGFVNPPITSHTRGKELAELVLNDNSKVRIFADTREEAERVLNQAILLINPGFLPETISYSYKRMADASIYQIRQVYPFRAIYLPNGAMQDPNNPPRIWYYDL